MSTRKATIRVANRQSFIRCDIKSKVISSDYSNIRVSILVGLNKQFRVVMPVKIKGGIPVFVDVLAKESGMSLFNYLQGASNVSHSPFYFPLVSCPYFALLSVNKVNGALQEPSVLLYSVSGEMLSDTEIVLENVTSDLSHSTRSDLANKILNEVSNML